MNPRKSTNKIMCYFFILICFAINFVIQAQNTGKNNKIRTFNSNNYTILEIATIVIYQRAIIQNKSVIPEIQYYFSQNIETEILPLSLENLAKTYKGNAKIYQMLDMRFSSREHELSEFDTIHKTYKVNYWLAQP
jgi:hypothetical protein